MKMGIKEQLKSIRKVRVIYIDPYATDSSSEDETPTQNNEKGFPRMKRVVKEIVLENADRKSIQNRKKRIPFSKYKGVRKKNSKFASEIRDPFSRKRIWLGTYHTEEEAAAAYNRKKREFQERENQIVDLPSNSSANSKFAETNSYPEIKQQRDLRSDSSAYSKSAETNSRNLDEEFLEHNIVPYSPREECQLDQEMNIWFDDEFRQQSISKLLGDSPILPNSMEMKWGFQNNLQDDIDIRNCFQSLHADMELIFSAENSEDNKFPEFDFEVDEQEIAWIDQVFNERS